MPTIFQPPHAFPQKFMDMGKLTHDLSYPQLPWLPPLHERGGNVVYGGDPCVVHLDNKFHLFNTPQHGSLLTGKGPVIGHWSSDHAMGPYKWEGNVLVPSLEGLAPSGIIDTYGIEVFTATRVGSMLAGLYHGFDSDPKVRHQLRNDTINLAIAHDTDPTRWTKIQGVITEDMVKEADPHVGFIYMISEPSIVWDDINRIAIGAIEVRSDRKVDERKSPANPFGGKAGHASRTYLTYSRDFVTWRVFNRPSIMPPVTRAVVGPNSCGHPALWLDNREPRVLHLFTTWSGNWVGYHEDWGLPNGIRHHGALADNWPPEFVENPNAKNGVLLLPPEPIAETSTGLGGPSPYLDSRGEWRLFYHGDAKWHKLQGTREEQEQVKELTTRGYRHIRMAKES